MFHLISYNFKKFNENYLIFVSLFFGWCILNFNLLNIYFDFKKYNILMYFILNKNLNFYLGFFKNFLYFILLKGIGLKILRIYCILIFNLGYAHKILFCTKNSFNFYYKNKQALYLSSRSSIFLKNFLFYWQFLLLENVYKLKGIFFKGSIIKLRLSSKKAKY